MPAQSKSQQRFFGVVKAMQKGDIPKKGKAGKIAKTMSKDDVDDFASTKHKGKPEKVKREQRVRELIKKMVREELAEMNEPKLNEFNKAHFLNLIKQEVDSLKGQVAYAKDKVNYKGTPDWEKKEFKGVLKDLLKKLKDTEKHYKRVEKLKEGTCGYGENGELGEEPAGPHLIKKIKEGKDTIFDVAKKVMKDKQHQNYKSKKGMVKLDMQTANLLTQVFKKVNPKMKKILSKMGEENPARLVQTLQAVVK